MLLYHPGTNVRPPAAAVVRGRMLFGPLRRPSLPFLFGPAAQRSPKPLATMLNWGCQSPGSAKRCSINVPSLGLASQGPTSVGVCMPCLSVSLCAVCLSLSHLFFYTRQPASQHSFTEQLELCTHSFASSSRPQLSLLCCRFSAAAKSSTLIPS